MRLRVLRRFMLIRLAISFVFDYWKINRLNRRLSGEEREKAVNRVCEKAGKRMRETAFRLKGIIVKVGQFLSMRQDVLPGAFIKELSDLQDALPAEDFQTIRPYIEKELTQTIDEVFQSFEGHAVAAASLAQVHRAVLRDGTKVAVKILRPKMEELAQADLDTLGLIAKVTQRFPRLGRKMNFVLLHREFTETIQLELNGFSESKHLQRFAGMFINDDSIVIPKVVDRLTTRRLIVMEYMEGAKVTDDRQLSEWKIDRKEAARTVLEAYLQQFLIHGFIHVDPHPGNLLILPGNRIGFLDFGMVDVLTEEEVSILRNLLQNIVFQNPDGILAAFERLGFLVQDSDYGQLKPVINHMLERLNGTPENQETPELDTVVAGLKSFLHNQSFQLQAKYMFLIRAIGILVSTLALIAPRNDWMAMLYDVVPSVMSSSHKERRSVNDHDGRNNANLL
ncbi:MAG TPA: AarF/UbiB family protein [Bacillales bacterium]|nr:AarF/UbiB family protein [Bacillales bacterium]